MDPCAYHYIDVIVVNLIQILHHALASEVRDYLPETGKLGIGQGSDPLTRAFK